MSDEQGGFPPAEPSPTPYTPPDTTSGLPVPDAAAGPPPTSPTSLGRGRMVAWTAAALATGAIAGSVVTSQLSASASSPQTGPGTTQQVGPGSTSDGTGAQRFGPGGRGGFGPGGPSGTTPPGSTDDGSTSDGTGGTNGVPTVPGSTGTAT